MAVSALTGYQVTTRFSEKTQTKYRESETQTDPWYPPYRINAASGTVPELITLHEFTWGKGLPYHLLDVWALDRIRKRKAWAQLFNKGIFPPKIVREAEIQLDRDDITFMELKIDYDNIERFELAEQELIARRNEKAKKRNDKVAKVVAKTAQDLATKKTYIKKCLDKEIRKLNKKDRSINYCRQNDLLEKYLEKSSNVCVYPSRYTVDNNLKHEKLAVTLEDEFELLCKIDNNRMYKKPYRSYVKKHVCNKQFWPSYHYQDIPLSIKRMSKNDEVPNLVISSVSEPENDDLQKAVVYIQRLIRGRAEQTTLHLKRIKFLDTITLLRDTYGFTRDTRKQASELRIHYDTAIRKYNFHTKILGTVMGVINQAQSAVLSSILDFTNKEMTRMRNERVVFDLVKGAQMTRWGRESREGGLRQKELRRRRQHEEMLKTVSKAHEVYVDEFLANLMDEAFMVGAEEEAREATEAKADLTDERFFERTNEAIERDMIITRLTFSYLIPESVRLPSRLEVEARQERHRREAYLAIFGNEEKDIPDDETKSEKELRELRVKKNQEAIAEYQIMARPELGIEHDQIHDYLKEFLMEAVERMQYAEKESQDFELPITFNVPSLSSVSASSLTTSDESSSTDEDSEAKILFDT
ncbi:cilia- and flagella-associated protein 91-like [Rhodnius prolixus]|uniref:cilia- and flagella-associated protein 91-like n=1 Tax=Rhodnius prolixus TaxID=13249 RepID=UPI003D18DCDC